MRTTLFVGSGFSVPAGLPTMAQFARTFRLAYESKRLPLETAPWLGRLDEAEVAAVAAAVHYAEHTAQAPEHLALNIEWVLAQLDMTLTIWNETWRIATFRPGQQFEFVPATESRLGAGRVFRQSPQCPSQGLPSTPSGCHQPWSARPRPVSPIRQVLLRSECFRQRPRGRSQRASDRTVGAKDDMATSSPSRRDSEMHRPGGSSGSWCRPAAARSLDGPRTPPRPDQDRPGIRNVDNPCVLSSAP